MKSLLEFCEFDWVPLGPPNCFVDVGWLHVRVASPTGLKHEAAFLVVPSLASIASSGASSTLLDARARRLRDLVRASVHYYNTEEEVARFAAAVAALAKRRARKTTQSSVRTPRAAWGALRARAGCAPARCRNSRRRSARPGPPSPSPWRRIPAARRGPARLATFPAHLTGPRVISLVESQCREATILAPAWRCEARFSVRRQTVGGRNVWVSQMPLAEADDMVQALAPDRTDKARSAKGFCQGLRAAVRTSWICMPFTRCRKESP
jgi:hypothetical protein